MRSAADELGQEEEVGGQIDRAVGVSVPKKSVGKLSVAPAVGVAKKAVGKNIFLASESDSPLKFDAARRCEAF